MFHVSHKAQSDIAEAFQSPQPEKRELFTKTQQTKGQISAALGQEEKKKKEERKEKKVSSGDRSGK